MRRMLETSEVCDYRKETSEGSGDVTLPGMSVEQVKDNWT